MARLMFMRHAQATHGWNDHGRGLTDIGRRQARQVAIQLAEYGPIDCVLVSDAQRTQETYRQLHAAGCSGAEVYYLSQLYGGGVADVWQAVCDYAHVLANPQAATMLVIGHEPTMSAAAFATWDGVVADADTASNAMSGGVALESRQSSSDHGDCGQVGSGDCAVLADGDARQQRSAKAGNAPRNMVLGRGFSTATCAIFECDDLRVVGARVGRFVGGCQPSSY
ncbi:SixA phosphatase family protein [Trueperella sp. LYQ143]|uniref:SixA phosphatase family protein n=1 Tax=unclassified Trueperella TaxID=2630174 RepID=UPI0039833B6F